MKTRFLIIIGMLSVGFSGITKSIADDSQNQILKSEITIYNMDKLSKARLRPY